MFIITTDGYENASRRYDYETVRHMIQRQKEKYGWEFLFLGANIDAAKEAARFGIGADRAVNYKCDEAGTALNYEVISEAVSQRSRRKTVSAPTGSAASTRMCRNVGDMNIVRCDFGATIVGSPYSLTQQLQRHGLSVIQPAIRIYRRYGNDAGRGTGPAGYSRTG